MDEIKKIYLAKKIVGIAFILISIIATAYILSSPLMSQTTYLPSEEPRPYGSGPEGLGIMIASVLLIVIVIPIFALGFFLLTYKAGKSPPLQDGLKHKMICNICNIEYDKTWKVCLKCRKPLVKKL